MESDVDALRNEVDQLRKSQNEIARLIERKNWLILKALPSVYGFPDMDAFVCALARFASANLRDKVSTYDATICEITTRGKYSSETRIAVRAALEASESPSQISRKHGMSLATIAKWRKVWGLAAATRGRKRKTLNENRL